MRHIPDKHRAKNKARNHVSVWVVIAFVVMSMKFYLCLYGKYRISSVRKKFYIFLSWKKFFFLNVLCLSISYVYNYSSDRCFRRRLCLMKNT